MKTLTPPWGHWVIEKEGHVSQNFIVIQSSATVSNALDTLEPFTQPAFQYLVAPLETGRFLVVRGIELFARIANNDDQVFDKTLQQLLDTLEPVAAIERGSQGMQFILMLRDQQPGKRLAYVQGSDIVGVVATDYRFGDPMTKRPCYRCDSVPPHVFRFGESLPRDTNGLRRCPYDGALLHKTKNC